MNAKTCFAALLACAVLVGCASGPRSGDGRTSLVCDGANACQVDVTPASSCTSEPCGGTADPNEVHLKRGATNVNIFWRLPPGFAFCVNSGDGVFLKSVDTEDQFDDIYPVDSEQPVPSKGKQCTQRQWHWTAHNTAPGRSYPYRIVFHSRPDNKLYVIDPIVVND